MRPSRTWTQLGRTFTQPWRLAQHRVISEYLLATIGVDTAENEPLKVHLIFKLWDLIFTEPPRPAFHGGGIKRCQGVLAMSVARHFRCALFVFSIALDTNMEGTFSDF